MVTRKSGDRSTRLSTLWSFTNPNCFDMATSRWTVIALALCGSCVGDSSRGAGEAAHEPRERAAGRSATAASRARGHRALLRNATRALGGAALDHGCALTATPFVFYHIAKTGGGTVREVMKHTAEKNGKKDVCLHCIKELPNMGCFPETPEQIKRHPDCQQPETKRFTPGQNVDIALGHYNVDVEWSFAAASAARAGLGVLRVTMLREPKSLIVSQYVYNRKLNSKMGCERFVGELDDRIHDLKNTNPLSRPKENVLHPIAIRLCGQHCERATHSRAITIDDAIARAQTNLRERFAVVGLTEEMDKFWVMLERRVAYMKGAAAVASKQHQVHKGDQGVKTRCGRQLASEKGQAALAGSKCMAQMHALYDTAREVFEHQWAELAACK